MKKLLTVVQASELLGINRFTLYKLIYARKIPYIRKEGLGLRLDPDQLETWTRQGEVEANG
jgi:excisionase family DNA binding protein